MTPARGFPDSEYKERVKRAQAAMQDQDIAALLLTTEADVRYFTGFLTRFWESPTRPWFLVVPVTGNPIAVIPSIGAVLMGKTWITDIRCWQAPNYEDDGVSLLGDTLAEVAAKGARIGVPSGLETHLGMPLESWHRLNSQLESRNILGDGGVLAGLRAIKSPAEIAKIKVSCGIADRAFARVPDIANAGSPLSAVFRRFQITCLDEGADWVPYLAGAAEQGGYRDVISPATDTPLIPGDVLMLDTGLVHDGYFCDFDRNFSIGPPSQAVQMAHAKLITATHAAFEVAKPGATAANLFHAMDRIVGGGSEAGRLGHGLGMQLTEGFSIIPDDHTVLRPGMVLTLEPGVVLGPDRIMVHEENIVIGDKNAAWLSTPTSQDILVID